MDSLTSGAWTGWPLPRPTQPGPHWTGKKTGPSNDEPAVWRRSLLSHGGPRQTGFAVCPEEQQLHEQLHSAQQQQQPQLHSLQAGQPGQQSALLAAPIWHCILKPIRSMMALPFSGRSGMASDSNTRPDRRAPSPDGLPRRFRGVQTKPGKTSWIPILNLACGHITGASWGASLHPVSMPQVSIPGPACSGPQKAINSVHPAHPLPGHRTPGMRGLPATDRTRPDRTRTRTTCDDTGLQSRFPAQIGRPLTSRRTGWQCLRPSTGT